MAAFEELGVMPEIILAVEALDWTLPTDIQAEAVPMILGGGDVLAAAETGSGKTGAFALPVTQVVHETLRDIATPKSFDEDEAGETKKTGFTLSDEDRDTLLAIDDTGLTCQARSPNWVGGRATIGITKGKYFYEATVTDEGLCRVGFSSSSSNRDLGTDRDGYGFGGTGMKSNAKQFTQYGEKYGKGDVVGCMLDMDAGQVSFFKNGQHYGEAFKIGAGARRGLFPAVVLKNAEMQFNFGQDPARPLRYPPAGGYEPFASAPPAHTTLAGSGPVQAGRRPLCVILEPSRELAEQTHQALLSFAKFLPPPQLSHLLLVGGVSNAPQLQALKQGVDIITATPGRLWDLVQSGAVDLGNIKFFVLDEADSLIESNHDLILQLHQRLSRTNLQVLLFSATLHAAGVRNMADKITRFPTWIDLKGKDAVPEAVHHAFVAIDPTKDTRWKSMSVRPHTDGIHRSDNVHLGSGSRDALSEEVKMMKPAILVEIINAYKMDQAMIFVRTKVDADNLEHYLVTLSGGKRTTLEATYSCSVLHGDRSVRERQDNLRKFKEGEVRFLICTDVAARGIDVRELPYMINYTLPDKPEDYIHRTGRVGRADRMGLAISLVSQVPEKVWYHQCDNKGKGCHNTALVENKGCALWYDEKLYWTQINTRLGDLTTPELTPENAYAMKASELEGEVVYGQRRGADPAHGETHTEELKDRVRELAALEEAAQKNFWEITCKYRKKN
eukprot:TRINITY_DN5186_c0_g1_i1.p1 TRINITY_DN5186_c0_g1~~TRINITY_DN5186_c0_g1_i1.p1  ORF type:complete len:740 (-),score=190.47 TRINITY_DN5186_c0_g1_i1:11-2194(-)